jgi:hypothetical protein
MHRQRQAPQALWGWRQGEHRHHAQGSKGGQFTIHAKALAGNPYDGHTLARVIPAIEQLDGNKIERAHSDTRYRGHNPPPDCKFKA